MTVYPCGKINLGLNVVSKRPDGYHNLETVFYPIGVYDELTITVDENETRHQTCTLNVEGLNIEGPAQNNLVVRAYNLLAEQHTLPAVKVNLKKNIPMQAGLGGGSSDCAYMIRALNEMFNLRLGNSDMQSLASRLGADCAFFIDPVPSYAEGIGDKIKPIAIDLSEYTIAIIKPDVSISTKEAYENIHPKRPQAHCLDIIKRPIEEWKDTLVNDFEESVMTKLPMIGNLKQRLYDTGAIYAAMSGSGSSLFAIYKEAPTSLETEFEECRTIITKNTISKFN